MPYQKTNDIEFSIIRKMDSLGLIGGNGLDIESTFLVNIIDVALRARDFNWAEKALNKYITYINEDDRNEIFEFLSADICIFEKQFENALQHISKVKNKTSYYYLAASCIKMIAFYELNEMESLKYTIDTLKLFIKRNKNIPLVYVKPSERFLKYFNILFKLKFHNKGNPATLLQAIKADDVTINKDWLTIQAEKLK